MVYKVKVFHEQSHSHARPTSPRHGFPAWRDFTLFFSTNIFFSVAGVFLAVLSALSQFASVTKSAWFLCLISMQHCALLSTFSPSPSLLLHVHCQWCHPTPISVFFFQCFFQYQSFSMKSHFSNSGPKCCFSFSISLFQWIHSKTALSWLGWPLPLGFAIFSASNFVISLAWLLKVSCNSDRQNSLLANAAYAFIQLLGLIITFFQVTFTLSHGCTHCNFGVSACHRFHCSLMKWWETLDAMIFVVELGASPFQFPFNFIKRL